MLSVTEGVGYKKEEVPKSLENKGGNLRKGGVSLSLALPASETSAATAPQAVPLASAFGEFSRGSQVRFVNGLGGGRATRLIDARSELHSFDRAGLGILTRLPAAFFFGCALANKVYRRSRLVVGCL